MKSIKISGSAQLASDNLATTIAKESGIAWPSSHLAVLVASLAPLDEPNNNGIRLSKEASEEFLTTIHHAQTNFSHLGRYFVCGSVIKEWIDYDTNETKVAFTFYKDLYQEEYVKLLEAQNEGTLGVSFELDAMVDSMEKQNDGTILVNAFEYTGMGLLGVIDNKSPAYSGGRIHQFAEQLKNRVSKCDHKELIFAEQIIEQCDQALEADQQDTVVDEIVSEIEEKILAKMHKEIEKKKKLKQMDMNHFDKTKPKEKIEMTEEQKALVASVRAELEGFIPEDVTDESLLDEKLVAQYREAKSAKEAEVNAAEKEDVSAEQKSLTDERFITFTTYKDDGSTEVKSSKACTYTWVDSDGNAQTETLTTDAVQTRVYAEEEIQAIENKVTAAEEKATALQAEVDAQKEVIAKYEAEQAEREATAKAVELASIKASLKDNKFVVDFTDEDYFNAEKVERAVTKQENENLKAEVEALKKRKPDTEEVTAEDLSVDTGHNEDEPESVGFPFHLIKKAFRDQ